MTPEAPDADLAELPPAAEAGPASRSCGRARIRRSCSRRERRAAVALDDALAEIDAGRKAPSPRWKVRFGLMLGLERVLATSGRRTSRPAPSSAATRSTRSPGCSPS